MLLSIIVCTYNREKYIYDCLQCLAKNTCQTDWEIVFVNNQSTDGTKSEYERFVSDYPKVNIRYFLETEQGLSFARNRGIKEAKGDWLVFLDDDAMVGEDYIVNLKEQLQTCPEASAFGGQIVPFFEDKEPEWLSKWSMGFVSAIDMGEKVKRFEEGKFPIGANMGISRKAIESVGNFNTQLGRTKQLLLGGEEKDLFLRMHAADLQIYYFPRIAVKHCIPAHRTTDSFIQKLGFGVGLSERLRTLSQSKVAYSKRLVIEAVKWMGTIVIGGYFCCCRQVPKARVLFVFRKEVTKGLFSRRLDECAVG